MRIVCFYHSLLSDWNHGNAHFLRGVVSELSARGHEVSVFEPEDGWSLTNLRRDCGAQAITAFHERYPGLHSVRYRLDTLDLDAALHGAHVVLVHEWNEPELVARIGAHRRRHGYLLLFHDTHHRMVTAPEQMAAYDLSQYDAVLAFGEVLRQLYVKRGLAQHAFTWHEAADTRVFQPIESERKEGLVWIGNWGDGERTQELAEFLLSPCKAVGCAADVYGVRYPDHSRRMLEDAGMQYRGFLPNYRVPEVFARHLLTVHVPRRPYVQALRGVPTIRVFEALACGIPLLSAPWHDDEQLFQPGRDFVSAQDGADMTQKLRTLLNEPALRAELSAHGQETIRARHTCAKRVDELFSIFAQVGFRPSDPPSQAAGSAAAQTEAP